MNLKLLVGLILIGSVASATTLATDDLKRRKSAEQRAGRVSGVADEAFAVFSDRIEFFSALGDVTLVPDEGFYRGEKRISPMELEPAAILWMEQGFSVPGEIRQNLLVCQDPRLPTGQKGLKDFCGIISRKGEIIFRFPVKQVVPTRMFWGIGVAPDGLYAEVWEGSLIEGEDMQVPGNPVAVYGWLYPDKFMRVAEWKKGHFSRPEWNRMYGRFLGRKKLEQRAK